MKFNGISFVCSEMPQFYKRKTARGERNTVEALTAAAEKLDGGGQSIRKTAKEFGLDKMTLHRFLVKKRNETTEVATGYAAVSEAHLVFSSTMEKDLGNHIKDLADMFFGLSKEKCLELAYEFAKKNDIQVPKSWNDSQMAGRAWWLGFKRRQNLSIRSPEATSLGRATAFNRNTVMEFYDNLASVMDDHHFKPEDIYNLDETGCTTVQKPRDVVTERGRKQVGAATSAERGELVTVVYAVSASGNVVPPMFIFPRVNFRDHFTRGGPTGSVGQANKSGWITEEIFLAYLDHLVQHARCSMERKLLLILDNHEAHISLKAIDFARANGIVMLTIPPHTSHRLQPLDKSVYGPFKSSYNRAMDAWLRNNQGKTMSIYDIPGLVAEAQLSAVTAKNILSGFQATGIFPYNRNIFTDVDFAPSLLTDRDVQGPAKSDSDAEGTLCSETNAPERRYVSPRDIVKFPKAPARKKLTSRKRRKTTILTSSPVRNEMLRVSHSSNSLREKRNENEDGNVEAEFTLLEMSDPTGKDKLINGDFLMVKLAGKARSVNFVVRVEAVISDEVFEGVFLRKIPYRYDEALFLPDEKDKSMFFTNDVILKLPTPLAIGGSARRAHYLKFDIDLTPFSV